MPGFKTQLGSNFLGKIDNTSCDKIRTSEHKNNKKHHYSSNGIDLLKSIIMESNENDLIYPNPTKGIVNISTTEIEASNINLELINMNGEIVYNSSQNIQGISRISIDISSHPSGVYFIKLVSDSEFISYKILKI